MAEEEKKEKLAEEIEDKYREKRSELFLSFLVIIAIAIIWLISSYLY